MVEAAMSDPACELETLRAELAASAGGDRYRVATFEPGDPARIPSRGLALFSLVARHESLRLALRPKHEGTEPQDAAAGRLTTS